MCSFPPPFPGFQADLVDELSGEGPFTLFAPTNDAFEDLSAMLGMTLPEILMLPNLADILTYHVLSDKILAEDLYDGEEIATVEGKMVEITIRGTEAFINSIMIIKTNLLASNGVVHIISGVLIPPTTVPPTPSPSLGVAQIALENGLTDLLEALTVVSNGITQVSLSLRFWQLAPCLS